MPEYFDNQYLIDNTKNTDRSMEERYLAQLILDTRKTNELLQKILESSYHG